MRDITLPGKTLPRIRGTHEEDWANACRTAGKAGADFDHPGLLTETCLPGNITKRVDASIERDAERLKISNLSEENRYIQTEYGKAWSI